MRDGEAEDVFAEVGYSLAKHNLEVALRQAKEECFRAAKGIAAEGLEGFKRMDGFVRRQYADEPAKMAEWDEIARGYESADDVIGGGE